MKHFSLCLLVLCMLPLALAQVSLVELDTHEVDVLRGGEVVHFDLELVNDGEEDLDEVYVEVLVDELDLEEKSSEKRLRVGKDKSFDVHVEFPHYLEEEAYVVDFIVYNEDDEVLRHSHTFDVRHYNHRLSVVDTQFFPQVAMCGERVRLDVTAQNIGQEDEENVRIHVSVPGLDYYALTELFALDNNGEEYTASTVLTVPRDAEEGEYTVELLPRYKHGDKKELVSTTLEVKCAPEKEVVAHTPQHDIRIINLDPVNPSVTGHVAASADPLEQLVDIYKYELLVTSALLLVLVLGILFVIVFQR